MNILCVCALGQHRSKLAAEYLTTQGFITRYRGSETHSTNPITREDIRWAQAVVYARNRHKLLVHKQFVVDTPEFVLDVTDDPSLVPEMWRRVLVNNPDKFYQEYTKPLVKEKLKEITYLLKSK